MIYFLIFFLGVIFGILLISVLQGSRRDEGETRKDLENAGLIYPQERPERKTGRWITEKIIYSRDYPTQYICHCSECGWGISAAESTGWAKFCPSCGAKMEEPE